MYLSCRAVFSSRPRGDRNARPAKGPGGPNCRGPLPVSHSHRPFLLLFSGGSPRLPCAAVPSRPAGRRRVRRRCGAAGASASSSPAAASSTPPLKPDAVGAPQVPSGWTSKQASTRGQTWLMSNRRRVAFGSSSARLSRSNLSFMTTRMQLCPSTSPLHMETCLFLKLSMTLRNEHEQGTVSEQKYFCRSESLIPSRVHTGSAMVAGTNCFRLDQWKQSVRAPFTGRTQAIFTISVQE
ncbi:uncharacterized protein LOC119324023 [Triticum dicoccoides]|uniref:uncharacterized protein LOC119324023 n=1 Tax=Triticum dicoccoides TaxID=85692 RepID=UPI001891259B|nr:uncharacterized protein LOC119324023 [Triticum dicoccoides]